MAPAFWLVVVACGPAGSQGARPPPPAAPQPSASLPASLSWKSGASFSATVNQQLTTGPGGAAPATLQLAVAARQTLKVTAVRNGTADLEVDTTSWSWRHPDGLAPVGSLPAPVHLRVGPDGVILSGTYWSMPLAPPLPGLDFFSAGLAPSGTSAAGGWSGTWQRTLADGTVLACQAQSPGPDAADGSIVQTAVHCPVTVHTFTADGSPDLVQGDVRALVRSRFDGAEGRVLATSYTSSFGERETTPQGATTTSGSVTTSIKFAY